MCSQEVVKWHSCVCFLEPGQGSISDVCSGFWLMLHTKYLSAPSCRKYSQNVFFASFCWCQLEPPPPPPPPPQNNQEDDENGEVRNPPANSFCVDVGGRGGWAEATAPLLFGYCNVSKLERCLVLHQWHEGDETSYGRGTPHGVTHQHVPKGRVDVQKRRPSVAHTGEESGIIPSPRSR